MCMYLCQHTPYVCACQQRLDEGIRSHVVVIPQKGHGQYCGLTPTIPQC